MIMQGANRILEFGIREKALRNLFSEALNSEDFQAYSTAIHKS